MKPLPTTFWKKSKVFFVFLLTNGFFSVKMAKLSGQQAEHGGIAQLARAIGSYPVGRRFESNFRYQARWSSG